MQHSDKLLILSRSSFHTRFGIRAVAEASAVSLLAVFVLRTWIADPSLLLGLAMLAPLPVYIFEGVRLYHAMMEHAEEDRVERRVREETSGLSRKEFDKQFAAKIESFLVSNKEYIDRTVRMDKEIQETIKEVHRLFGLTIRMRDFRVGAIGSLRLARLMILLRLDRYVLYRQLHSLQRDRKEVLQMQRELHSKTRHPYPKTLGPVLREKSTIAKMQRIELRSEHHRAMLHQE